MKKESKLHMSRLANRGSFEPEVIHRILDEALLCTIAYSDGEEVFQIPTGFVRVDDTVYIHGSVGSHFLRQLADGRKLSFSATLLDGIVLARSVFDSSMNYRSVIAFSNAFVVDDMAQKRILFEKFTEKMIPGRWNDVRQPSDQEINKTTILGFSIKEASAKVREGLPFDGENERDPAVWWGILPMQTVFNEAIAHPELKSGVLFPPYLQELTKQKGS